MNGKSISDFDAQFQAEMAEMQRDFRSLEDEAEELDSHEHMYAPTISKEIKIGIVVLCFALFFGALKFYSLADFYVDAAIRRVLGH